MSVHEFDELEPAKSPNDRDTLPPDADEKTISRVLTPEEQTVVLLQIQEEVTESLNLMRRGLDTALAIYDEHRRDRLELEKLKTKVESLEQWRAGFATSVAKAL